MKRALLCFAVLLMLLLVTSCTAPDKTDIIPTDQPENAVPTVPENITDEINKESITLYFPDSEILYLHKEIREVEIVNGENVAGVVLEELVKGPTDEGLTVSIHGEDVVRSVSVTDGVCTVDFSYDFVVLNTGVETVESFAIASVVNSLCDLEGVDSVKILIDGIENADFGHSVIEDAYKPFTELVA